MFHLEIPLGSGDDLMDKAHIPEFGGHPYRQSLGQLGQFVHGKPYPQGVVLDSDFHLTWYDK
jgi:hypothetical protein